MKVENVNGKIEITYSEAEWNVIQSAKNQKPSRWCTICARRDLCIAEDIKPKCFIGGRIDD